MMDIFWYCYLGFLAVCAIEILITSYQKPFIKKLDFVLSVITWIGLFGYVTNTEIFIPLVWKSVFVIGLRWEILSVIKNFNNERKNDDEISLLIIGFTFIFLIGPLYFGLFNYAFK
ncbi:hypothetical protein [Niallia sp. NCCP-28]|uniref:hypothetical protein n=1 Tax=Niallia sp. NCCP-28 TaxID=2934712 RepID=UPI002083B7E6|nr:hypothetical protein [Niallia sp. NCCP-28]GKU84010.1 hypothetical protein NCCP28_34060 [Niallia sp. NCCP-28]